MVEAFDRQRDLTVISVLYRNDREVLIDLMRQIESAGRASGIGINFVLVVNDDRDYSTPYASTMVCGHGNVGFAAGVRIGISHQRTQDLVVVINPDCVVDNDQFRPFLERMHSLGDGEIVTPVICDERGEPDYRAYESWVFTLGRRVAEFVCRRFMLHSRSSRIPRFAKVPGTCIGLTRSTALSLNGPFDTAFFLYGEDRDMSMRARRIGIRLSLVRDAKVGHIGGSSGEGIEGFVHRCKVDANIRIAQRRYGVVGRVLAVADQWMLAWLRHDSGARSAARWGAALWLRNRQPPAINAGALRRWSEHDGMLP